MNLFVQLYIQYWPEYSQVDTRPHGASDRRADKLGGRQVVLLVSGFVFCVVSGLVSELLVVDTVI